jgi:serine phosphatase RsbU (regulator of sigma subunit)
MLRFALHSDGPLAEALTKLNRVLAEQDLLSGFATLFVGVYDSQAGTLSYVNCGQEPGLIWRAATGQVEMLPPTGPVLGGFDAGEYAEAEAALSPGDVLALFTDGMTEVGPTRRRFLEIGGLAALFARCCSGEATTAHPPSDVAASVVARLISGVEVHAGGAAGLRDDIALLVGVVG